MPTYEYICIGCEHEFEAFQSITARPIRDCPECGKKKVKRKISTGAAIIFKGGGFYETDYRSDAYKKSAEADKAPKPDAKPDAAKADAPKADTTPKPEPKPAKAESKPAKPRSKGKSD
jgi:putative FmdB family regulatory protein